MNIPSIISPIKQGFVNLAHRIQPPPWLRAQEESTKNELKQATRQYIEVIEKSPRVDTLAKIHELDRRRNNYGERVARAMGGRI